MDGVSLRSVSKSYDGKRVLEQFSHTFPSVGVVALLGPSGCGKTTLLRLLAGLEKAESGAVEIPAGARISMVFQEDRLLESLTALGNLVAVLERDTPAAKQLALDYLEQMGLGDAAEEYPSALSGGMRRRVAVARALAYGGDILMLDEPFKGLDAATKAKVSGLVFPEERRGERLTVLVTHDPLEAAQADTVLELAGPPLRVVRSRNQ